MLQLLFGELLLKQGVQRAEKGLLCPGLCGLTADKVGNHKLDLCFWRGRKRRLEVRNIGDARRSLSEDLLSIEMLYQWVEARVPGNDVKVCSWIFGRKGANVIGNVKVQGVGSGRV